MMRSENIEDNRVAFVVAACAVAIVLNLSWFGVYTFVNAFLTGTLGQTDAEWTQSTLWFLGGMLVGQLVCTEVSVRIGRRNTVTLALVFAAGAYLCLALFSRLWIVRLTMALMGLTPAILLVVWLAMVTEYGGDKPGKSIARVMLINSIIGAIILGVGSKMCDLFYIRSAFILFSMISILCSLIFHIYSRKFDGGTPTAVMSLFRLKKVHCQGLFLPAFITVVLAGFCIEAFLSLTINQLFPNHAHAVGSLSDYAIGNIVAVGRLPALVCLLIVSLFIDRINPRLCYGFGLMAAGGLVVGTGYGTGAVTLVVVYLLFYLVYGIIWGSNMASLNASVDASLRDAAFAIASAMAVVSIVLVGSLHRMLLGANVALSNLFLVCGSIGVGGGLFLVCSHWFGIKERTIDGQRL